MNFFPRNNLGWIRIVEAFVAILLITGVLLIFIGKGNVQNKSEIPQRVYDVQNSILDEINLNDTFREEILELPVGDGLDSSSEDFPKDLIETINRRTPNYLNCIAKICPLDKICPRPEGLPLEKDIYSQDTPIAANSNTYNPRQVKLFCWTK
ncbi:hypothetical protein J4474_04750 [Candidatus Pacearchaeota archaeon]|nr:hypothetical protein [Candidatus Pacearchaeota archaeon]